MASDDMKLESILQADELDQVLKALAGGFRHAVEPEALKAFAPHLASCSKLELSIKQLGGMAEMKLKVKGVGLAGAAVADGVLGPVGNSYKAVKKRLKMSFKFLQHSLLDSLTLPPAEIMEAFLKDSLAMCNHPDRGDYDYAPYLDALNRFKTAYDVKDRAALADTLIELGSAKRTCHVVAK